MFYKRISQDFYIQFLRNSMKEVILGVLSLPAQIMIIFVCIILIILVILKIKKSTLKKEINSQKSSREEYIEELTKTKKSGKSPEEKVDLLNDISKRIFEEKYGLNQKSTYNDLTKKLRERGQEQLSIFSKQMSLCYYSGEKLNKEKINKLIEDLIKIIMTTDHDIEKVDKKKSKFDLKRIKKNSDNNLTKYGYLNTIQKNPGIYTDLKKSFELTNRRILDLNKLIRELYTKGDKKTKQKIKRAVNNYKKQTSNIAQKTESPFKRCILQQNILKEHFKEIELLK